ncbi:alpha/beta hydrolase [Thermostilla marina]
MKRLTCGFRIAVAVCLIVSGSFVFGQQPIPRRPPVPPRAQPQTPRQPVRPAAPQPAATQPKPATTPARPVRLPPPVEIGGSDLLTKDGVQLTATYYPSTKGKDAVVLVLLHDYKGSRRDFAPFAEMLQQAGHAVFVPDLRGHGDSTRAAGPRGPITLRAEDLPATAYAAMVQYDMEAIKSFLLKENNAEKLNIEKLGVLGVGMGATVACDWARLDWSWPIYPGLKQGQDVKALILISPQWSLGGRLNLQAALQHPAVSQKLSVFLVVGRSDSKAAGDAKRIYNLLKRFHPDPPEGQEAMRDLVYVELPTRLQGRELFGKQGLQLERWIMTFVENRLDKQPFPWAERSKK